jgi:hypothetical protein
MCRRGRYEKREYSSRHELASVYHVDVSIDSTNWFQIVEPTSLCIVARSVHVIQSRLKAPINLRVSGAMTAHSMKMEKSVDRGRFRTTLPGVERWLNDLPQARFATETVAFDLGQRTGRARNHCFDPSLFAWSFTCIPPTNVHVGDIRRNVANIQRYKGLLSGPVSGVSR